MKAEKMMKTILLFLAITVLMTLLYTFITRHKNIPDSQGMINTRESELISITYSYGGGMDGESLCYSLTVSDNGETAFFEYSHCPYNGADTLTATKEVPAEYFDNIRTICRQTKCLLQAKKGKPGEFEVLDAAVAHINFLLPHGKVLTMYSTFEYGKSCDGLFDMIEKEMQKILDNEITA